MNGNMVNWYYEFLWLYNGYEELMMKGSFKTYEQAQAYLDNICKDIFDLTNAKVSLVFEVPGKNVLGPMWFDERLKYGVTMTAKNEKAVDWLMWDCERSKQLPAVWGDKYHENILL